MNHSGIEIRTASADEASEIAAVLSESFIEYQPLYTEAGYAATTPPSDQLKQRMNEGPLWVAVLERVVGTVSAVPKDKDLYIRGMAVLPSVRGQKVGELLLQVIETYAAENGFQKLILSTTPFLDRAIRLYERFGFVRSDDGPHDLFGTPLFSMEKHLGS